MRAGSVDCPACGPQPGSRTHLARQHDPYLLYLVDARGLTKFGMGAETRVREHQRAGAAVIQVLRATFAEVVLAERALKVRHADQVVGQRTRKMPASFGQGTEVVKGVAIDLPGVLPGGLDVTAQFQRSTGQSARGACIHQEEHQTLRIDTHSCPWAGNEPSSHDQP